MYKAGQVYWAYVKHKKTRVLVLEPDVKGYKVLLICKKAEGPTFKYTVDLRSLSTIYENDFVSYIDDLNTDMFKYVYDRYNNRRKVLEEKTSSSTSMKKHPPKKADRVKVCCAPSWNTHYGRSGGGYANPNWLPPGNTRIKVYRG